MMMEYTTPPSYGSTVVNVGGIEVDGKTIYAGASNTASHTSSKEDEEVRWPEPTSVSYQWEGKDPSGEDLTFDISTDLQKRTDRVDVMAEVPGFVKQIVAGAAGTRPYIYQVRDDSSTESRLSNPLTRGAVCLESVAQDQVWRRSK